MSDPVIDPSDLGIYLTDTTINVVKAMGLILDAQTLCEDIISPLPAAASVIVKRVAGRAYSSTTAARQVQLGQADAAFGATPGPVGGVYLTRYDVADLRRMAGGGGAFSINMLPADYATTLAPWDINTDPDVATS